MAMPCAGMHTCISTPFLTGTELFYLPSLNSICSAIITSTLRDAEKGFTTGKGKWGHHGGRARSTGINKTMSRDAEQWIKCRSGNALLKQLKLHNKCVYTTGLSCLPRTNPTPKGRFTIMRKTTLGTSPFATAKACGRWFRMICTKQGKVYHNMHN
jgi:hypothetical protein